MMMMRTSSRGQKVEHFEFVEDNLVSVLVKHWKLCSVVFKHGFFAYGIMQLKIYYVSTLL